MMRQRRGQANLLAVAIAIVLLLAATGISLSVTAGAFDAAEREPTERRLAAETAAWFVADSSPVTSTQNAIAVERLEAVEWPTLDSQLPLEGDVALRVSVNGSVVLQRGAIRDGTTVRRLVLLEHVHPVTRTVRLRGRQITVTLNRSDRVNIDFGDVAAVEYIRVDGRVRLRNASGLRGNYTVTVRRNGPTQLTFVGDLTGAGNVTIRNYQWRSEAGEVVVTVDD